MDAGHTGRILIADDEEIFLHSTADLLRREGFHCDCVPDADAAIQRLKEDSYDLIIADIKMPGNPELELVHKLPEIAPGLPVVIVTGYPSLRSAIQSVQLPVVAYLVKPIVLEELLELVRAHTERFRAYRAVRDAQDRLQTWFEELARIEQVLRVPPLGEEGSIPVESFLSVTLRNIVGSLSDLQRLVEAVMHNRSEQESPLMASLPQPARLLSALEETIGVLEKTKSAFKSKDLGELRKKLEGLVKETRP
jgi:YesN/AraC family two-component response regulator